MMYVKGGKQMYKGFYCLTSVLLVISISLTLVSCNKTKKSDIESGGQSTISTDIVIDIRPIPPGEVLRPAKNRHRISRYYRHPKYYQHRVQNRW